MAYETVILELMERVQALEAEVIRLRKHESDTTIAPATDIETPTEINERKKVTAKMLEACYKAAEINFITNNERINDISVAVAEQTGMNRNTALVTIQGMAALIKGELFKRSMSIASFRFVLDRVYSEKGVYELSISLNALNNFINYYKGQGHNASGLESLYCEYEGFLCKATKSE